MWTRRRQNAVIEDVDLRTPRCVDRALFRKLVAGDWIDRAEGRRRTIDLRSGCSVLENSIPAALSQRAELNRDFLPVSVETRAYPIRTIAIFPAPVRFVVRQ